MNAPTAARLAAWLLLAASFGVLMPTLVDGSLFTADDPDIEDWDEIMTTTDVGGISVYAVTAWVAGHVALSIGAPIAIAEASSRRGDASPGSLAVFSTIRALASPWR